MPIIVTSVGKSGAATKTSFRNLQRATIIFRGLLDLPHILYAQLTLEDGKVWAYVKPLEGEDKKVRNYNFMTENPDARS